jgi:hypothetical protein
LWEQSGAPGTTVVSLGTDGRQLEQFVEVAGPVVAWSDSAGRAVTAP